MGSGRTVVRTGLGEVVESEDAPGVRRRTLVRHASARPMPAPVEHEEAVPSDRWTPPLVAAKLQNMAMLFRRDRVRGLWPREEGTCMPEPILDRGCDYAPAVTIPQRPLSGAELDHAIEVFGIVLSLWPGDEDATSIVWCIANRMDYADAADEMNAATWRRKRNWTARNIRYHWAENIAPKLIGLFTKLDLRVDPEDLTLARRRSFHRNI